MAKRDLQTRRGWRKLVANGVTYRWGIGHAHTTAERPGVGHEYEDCREVVSLRLDGRAPGVLVLVFRGSPSHVVPDGYMSQAGVIVELGPPKRATNLNEPGVVRALLDAALARGWDAAGSGRAEMDGWAVLDSVRSVLDSRARAR